MTTMAHDWKPSPAQVELLKTIFIERVPENEPGREQGWINLTQNVSNLATFQDAIAKLKARPRVGCSAPYCNQFLGHEGGHTVKAVAPAVPESRPVLATEDGLYRNPADGTLYRLSTPAKRNSWDRPQTVVSTYSNKATVRRLTPEGRMVKKGKWTRLNAQASRQHLGHSRWDKPGQIKIEASWQMTEEQSQEWAVGICLSGFCYRSLVDAISVYNQIGPVCAKRYGIDRQTPPEV